MTKNLLNKITHLCCLIIIILLFSACSNNISKNVQQYNNNIVLGDSILLNWNFKSADSVYIDKLNKNFNNVDSIFVTPKQNTTYNIYGYTSKEETYKIQWNVKVINYLKSGFDIFDLTNLKHSNIRSNYLLGVTNSSTISTIKIVGIENLDSITTIKFIPLDKFGNFISEINFKDTSLISYITLNTNKSTSIPIDNISEKKIFFFDTNKINFYFCVDNSQASNRTEIYNQLSILSKHYNLSDNYFITYFNQNTNKILPILKDTNNHFMPFIYSTQSGINATNKALYNLINSINKSTTCKNKIILITQGADNASLLHTEQEISNLAKNKNIQIYIIVIGTTIPTYNFEYITNTTGGKLYLLDKSDIFNLYNLIHEIIFSQKFYYRINIKENFLSKKELILNLSIKDINNVDTTYDNYTIPLEAPETFANYKTLALFNGKTTKVQEEYYSNLKFLADTLNKNPDLIIKLIGHTFIKNSTQNECNKIALSRAQNTRRKIIEFGANPSQIRIASESNYSPIYLQPTEDWQELYNNRVELFWIIPSEQPYEIMAGIVNSENIAKKEIDIYEKYGYKAYYERINIEEKPFYRIFIWGYSTELEAIKTKEKLIKLFNRDFKIR